MIPHRNALACELSIAVIMLLVLSGTSVIGEDVVFKEEGTESHPVLITLDNVSTISIGKPDSRKYIFWNDDEVFMAVVRNETAGHYFALLYRSTDGGISWDEPVEVMNRSGIFLMRAVLHISNDTLYYLVFIAVSYRDSSDLGSRSLHCFFVGTDDWMNIGHVTPQRVDDEVMGYMPSYQFLEFKGDVYVFWVRSHYMDALYRKCSGGKWGTTKFLEVGTHISEFSAVRSNVSGTEMIHFAFIYHITGKVHVMGSVDGKNWSSPSNLWSSPDSFERISLTEWKGRLHLVLSEYSGYDIYHSWSTDGSSWVPFMKIAENTLNDLRPMDPQTNTVVIAGNRDIDSLLVALDSNSGVELLGSRNNGESFERLAFFKNDTAFYPNFCSEGKLLMYVTEGNELVVRRLGNKSLVEPPEDDGPVDPPGTPDDNSTDPPKPPDDNSTVPPDNGTDDGPVTNGTTPPPSNGTTGPDDDTTGEGNDTSPEPLASNNRPPDEPRMVFMEGDFLEGMEISIRGSGSDPDENDTLLNYTWYIEGIGIVGYGPSLRFTLPEGTYNLTLRVTDQQGAYSEMTCVLVVRSPDGGVVPENTRKAVGLVMFSLLIVLILLFLSVAVFFLRRSSRKQEADQPTFYMEVPDEKILHPGNERPTVAPAPPEPGSDILARLAEPTPFDPSDGIRRGILKEDHPIENGHPFRSENLDELKEAVEERGIRGRSEISALKMKAEQRFEYGDVPQNVYQEIRGILDQHGN